MRKIFITIIMFYLSLSCTFAQNKNISHYPYQAYIEDSAEVFWTWYPNPFCPSTIIGPIYYDTVKTSDCINWTFDCKLSDTVQVAFKDGKDSICYSKYITSDLLPHFMFCLWIAGSKVQHSELPKDYFFNKNGSGFDIVLIVDNREKCYRTINGNKYFWITEKLNQPLRGN